MYMHGETQSFTASPTRHTKILYLCELKYRLPHIYSNPYELPVMPNKGTIPKGTRISLPYLFML